ncbi:MAG: lipoyl(octanoyl) transferase LipB [Gammaproteobacteria bacterium]|nr:lipoyl(octanoyl) transferase LipB [Gammaproteobacteria bacterium]
MAANKLIVRTSAGIQDYVSTWRAMQTFTISRNIQTSDELWLTEHPAVFTQGLNGKPEHVLNPGDIPIIPVDRGGQITYHGPGQAVFYTLFDLNRLDMGVTRLVYLLEQSIIDYLQQHNIIAARKSGAPGVYIEDDKIASLGLRIKKNCAYHGLSFNIDMDLEPFSRINPCGLSDIKMTQLRNFLPNCNVSNISQEILTYITRNMNYQTRTFETRPIT